MKLKHLRRQQKATSKVMSELGGLLPSADKVPAQLLDRAGRDLAKVERKLRSIINHMAQGIIDAEIEEMLAAPPEAWRVSTPG